MLHLYGDIRVVKDPNPGEVVLVPSVVDLFKEAETVVTLVLACEYPSIPAANIHGHLL